MQWWFPVECCWEGDFRLEYIRCARKVWQFAFGISDINFDGLMMTMLFQNFCYCSALRIFNLKVRWRGRLTLKFVAVLNQFVQRCFIMFWILRVSDVHIKAEFNTTRNATELELSVHSIKNQGLTSHVGWDHHWVPKQFPKGLAAVSQGL